MTCFARNWHHCISQFRLQTSHCISQFRLQTSHHISQFRLQTSHRISQFRLQTSHCISQFRLQTSNRISQFRLQTSHRISQFRLQTSHRISQFSLHLRWKIALRNPFSHNKSSIVYVSYSESIFIHWHQFSWFLQNALPHEFLNSWFQTLQATINEEIVIYWIFIFMVLVDHEISEN